jgi:ribose 5-phosphate isomerase A
MEVVPKLRHKGEEIYLTDNGNYLLDCVFGSIPNPAKLHHQLKQLLGVVETGLFVNMAHRVIVGFPSGEHRLFSPAKEAVRLSRD